jgi:ankyrin repeat protein
VDAGANMELEFEGATALFHAHFSARYNVFRYLLESGADYRRLYMGSNLLHLAASHANFKVYLDLLDRGFDSNLRNVDGDTAFDIVRVNNLELCDYEDERQTILSLMRLNCG